MSNSNTIRTVLSHGEMWGIDELAPWQQKQNEERIAKTPKATVLLFSQASLITHNKMFKEADSSLMLEASIDFYTIFVYMLQAKMRICPVFPLQIIPKSDTASIGHKINQILPE